MLVRSSANITNGTDLHKISALDLIQNCRNLEEKKNPMYYFVSVGTSKCLSGRKQLYIAIYDMVGLIPSA